MSNQEYAILTVSSSFNTFVTNDDTLKHCHVLYNKSKIDMVVSFLLDRSLFSQKIHDSPKLWQSFPSLGRHFNQICRRTIFAHVNMFVGTFLRSRIYRTSAIPKIVRHSVAHSVNYL